MITGGESRNHYLNLSDDELCRQCRFDPYQASGPGGQKRNRSRSAVRLIHLPSGIAVTAAESRSQHDNRRFALARLRRKIALEIRGETPSPLPDFSISLRNSQYPILLAAVCDLLDDSGFRVSDTASRMGLSTARLIRFLARDHELWQHVNEQRRQRNMPTLSSP